jgi:hypothetical protein
MSDFLMTGDTRRKALDKIRAQIADIDAEAEQMADAPVTLAEVRERFADALADARRYSRESVLKGATLQQPYPALDFKQPLALVDIAELFGDQILIDKLTENVRADCKGGISLADRAKRTAALKEQRAKLVDDDEREVCRLENAGYLVDRPYFDVARALAIWDEVGA